MRGGGVGKSYDPISNDRDGFGQPDGKSENVVFYKFYCFSNLTHIHLLIYLN